MNRLQPGSRVSVPALAATLLVALAAPASSQQNPATLEQAFEPAFRIGATPNTAQIFELNPLDWPTLAQQDSTIQAFADLGIKVNVTGLDIDVLPRREGSGTGELTAAARDSLDPYRGALPDSVQQALARRYAELFGVYLKHRDAITRVAFWDVTGRQSWLNGYPLRGRTNHPLLFDRAGRPKPALQAVLATTTTKDKRP